MTPRASSGFVRALPALALVAILAGCIFAPRGMPTPYYQDVIAGDPFTDLVVEIDHAPEHAPSVLAQEHLLQELRNVTAKTRVSIIVREALPGDSSHKWTSEELIATEKATRVTQHVAPIAVLHVLYPAGEYGAKDGVAGITISGPVLGPVTIFLDTIDKLQSPAGGIPIPPQARDDVERATLLHEAGHAMGLVDNGLPMVKDHEDHANPGHSSDNQSVMFWRVETLKGIRDAFLHDGSVPIYFDENDRADLRSVGGR